LERRAALLNGELFYSLKEAQIIIENWRRHCNGIRPHTSLGCRPPASETYVPNRIALPSPLVGAAGAPMLDLAIRPTLH
jgi:hypothetical protein